jgi:hypothetical protein
MELKDVILSTLAEMEDDTPVKEQEVEIKEQVSVQKEAPLIKKEIFDDSSSSTESELIYLNSIRERLLVLFEGFQAPNNSNIEAKVDMTLNFLEYTLATIDARVEKLKKGNM